MTHKALIRKLQISCLGLDRIDPLCLLVDDVIEALSQPKRTWVGLTDEEIDHLAEFHGLDYMSYEPFTKAIEAKLKEKNT